MGEENQEKKIIIDEDWKSQVEAEKEAAKHVEPAADAETSETSETSETQPRVADEDLQLPPASFALLVSTFATQAMSAMGQFPDPVEGKPVVRLPVARHFIDSLAVLEEKTKGNLTAEEAQMLEDAVHQLRMAFVAVQQSVSASPTQEKADPS